MGFGGEEAFHGLGVAQDGLGPTNGSSQWLRGFLRGHELRLLHFSVQYQQNCNRIVVVNIARQPTVCRQEWRVVAA